MKKYTKGFTLIELLVVIAIIGILASVVLVSLNSARNKGKDARVISDVQQLRTWLEAKYNGVSYPLTASATCNTDTNSNTNATYGACVTGNDANSDLLNSDANGQSGSPLYVSVSSASTPGYAIRGKLPSQATATYFCIDSTGATNVADSGTNAGNAGRCK